MRSCSQYGAQARISLRSGGYYSPSSSLSICEEDGTEQWPAPSSELKSFPLVSLSFAFFISFHFISFYL